MEDKDAWTGGIRHLQERDNRMNTFTRCPASVVRHILHIEERRDRERDKHKVSVIGISKTTNKRGGGAEGYRLKQVHGSGKSN